MQNDSRQNNDLRHKSARPGPTGQLLAMLFALAFPTLATWLYFVALAGHSLMQPAYASTKVLQFAFPVFWVFVVQRRRIRLERPKIDGIALGLAMGVAVVAGILALYYGYLKTSPFLSGSPERIAEKVTGLGVDSAFKFFVMAVLISIPHSLLEEYYWRWFVFGQLHRSLPLAAAIVISSLGFMAHHVLVVGQFLNGFGPVTWLLSFAVAIGGGLWAWLYHRTGTLYGSWASHLLVDAGLMWVGFDLWRSAT